jgi:L-serine dehydratase
MRSIADIFKHAQEHGLSLPQTILVLDSEATGVPTDEIRAKMASRTADMARCVEEARANKQPGKLVACDGGKLRAYIDKDTYSGPFVTRACAIAVEVATYNAAMGRIVAAPTAGSSGIIPGLLFAWKELYGKEDAEEKITDALVIAGAFGEVIASRATLAGAEGGCQAECGAAAAMGAAALVWLKGGSGETAAAAMGLALISILGLVCDPVGGLVECPCVKRNGALTALGAVSADMALAGVRPVIPVDEVIDAMGQVGKLLPPALRETSRAGLAASPTAKQLVKEIFAKK